ncbi:hypothetical protein LOK49_LG11G01211 [Camellia lanceoleosa]|uniref:Uncharacterized protein n=1 Tax=Camellia lanceoleosa TaxID=1840588 RepID=A0ACC0G2D0_9ERIC|nr:hypothetical protein LOK49_LG11G01211 [Camellia lanceoleosa]
MAHQTSSSTHGSSLPWQHNHHRYSLFFLSRMKHGEEMAVAWAEMAKASYYLGLTSFGLFHLCLVRQQRRGRSEIELVSSRCSGSLFAITGGEESRDPPLNTTFCLPAKKRVFAFHPNFIPQKPISPFDLNIEYNPPSNNEESDSQEVNDVPIATDNNNSIQITEDCPEKAQDEDEDENEIECAICQSTDGDPSNPIVFCDGCDLMVHHQISRCQFGGDRSRREFQN